MLLPLGNASIFSNVARRVGTILGIGRLILRWDYGIALSYARPSQTLSVRVQRSRLEVFYKCLAIPKKFQNMTQIERCLPYLYLYVFFYN